MGKVLLTIACGIIAGKFHHVFGVAPILGAILCAVFFLRPKELLLIGWGGMLLRDAFLGYSAFTLVRLMGIAGVVGTVVVLRIKPSFRSLLIGLLVSSPVFHLTLAVGNWWTGTCGQFPKTLQGLGLSIASSFPYFQRSFLGDLAFTGLFVGLYLGSLTCFKYLSLPNAIQE